jgi:hypothetical protein
MGLTELINQPVSKVFRRAYIKRKSASTGLYESDWQNITPYVIRWGNITSSVDDVRLNRFNLSGITIQVDNSSGKFNDENNISSLWYGYLTRYGTLLKIEAGYQTLPGATGWGDAWGFAWGGTSSEYPTDPTQGIFILDQEISIPNDNNVTLNASSLKAVFENVKATEVPGIGATLTASEIVELIKSHSDGAGLPIFQQFISSGAWHIQTTTNYYNFATSTSLNLQDVGTAWGLLEKLAEAEGYVLTINRSGEFIFTDRTANTTASQFSFYGQGFPRQNVIRVNSYKEALNKVYNSFRLKYLTPDTTSSYVTAATSTTIAPANVQWKYGARIYEFENTAVLNVATAQGIVDNLFNEFSSVKGEVDLIAKFNPELDPLDRVDVSHYSYSLADKTLWDGFNWDEAEWSKEGENFDWDNKAFKIISKSINLDDFSESFRMREI